MDIQLIEVILFAGTVVLALLSFIGLRIFRHIDLLILNMKDFQKEVDNRIDNFRHDFDSKCNTVHSRLTKHGERIAKLEVK